jgi:predicted Zn-dependent protease with MMP-like domain
MDEFLREFEQWVQEALDLVPEEFQPYLENVEILIEEEASPALLRRLRVPRRGTLYGLYTGTPLTERHHDYSGLPDRITLFWGPLMDDFPEPEDLRRQVAVTVLHEIAHHLGIGEARLKELGLG